MVPFAASPGHENRIGFTMRFPLGVVCAITPFNSPLNTVLHKVAPAFAAGNAVILKPSALTPLTSGLLCRTLLEAGLPPGLLNLVQGEGETVGNALLSEQAIGFYAFTGSTRVGRLVQQAAGLRRTQLELGSIASTIVCADADMERAVPKIANAAFRKAGQVCTSVQRLFVEKSAMADVTERLTTEIERMPVGDPRDAKTRVGPMISEEQAQRAESWIVEAREQGARARSRRRAQGAAARADGARQRAPRHEGDRSRGVLPAGFDHPVREPGRGRRGRKCDALWPVGRAVHQQRRARAAMP